MKDYYIKFLPVEGTPKYLDWIYLDNLDTYVQVNISMNYSAFNKYQKYKLYLCSRDIQIGDKNIYPSFEAYKKDLKFLTTKYNVNDFKKNGIKIIAEISKEVGWLTENDEFDRNDFTIMWENTSGQRSFSLNDINQNNEKCYLVALFKENFNLNA